MSDTPRSSHLPSPDRLSVLAAVIMLAYSLNQFMKIPTRTITLQIPGLFLQFEINDIVLTAFVVAGIAATGTHWLLHDHPARKNQSIFPHMLIPAITALVIGIPLNRMTIGINWWVGLLTGTIILVFVFLAEYIVIDLHDVRQPLAAASLAAVGFAIYLVLAVTLREAGTRLFFILPTLLVATWLVCLRSLNLRLRGEWVVYESAIVAFVVAQLAAAIHYWPLSPIRFGMILLGPAYALTSLLIGLIEEKPTKRLIVEPVIVLGLSWLAAILLV